MFPVGPMRTHRDNPDALLIVPAFGLAYLAFSFLRGVFHACHPVAPAPAIGAAAAWAGRSTPARSATR